MGPANQYTDFFPYLDRLWFGESFRYNQMTPDEWLVTFSGIPFGMMSEMLQGGGNRYLGMVYGTTPRHSWQGTNFSPGPVWKLWKDFGIEKAKMIGYWDKACPVTTNHPNVKATAYVREGKTLISIGNFDAKVQSVRLSFDWKALGLDSSTAVLEAPFVKDFQNEKTFKTDEMIPVKSKEGWLLILRSKAASVCEETISLTTYPFADPDPVPHPSSTIYPCFRFDGFTAKGQPQEWKTVVLENDYIKVTVIAKSGNYTGALADIEKSKLWPENFGAGKPYDADIDLRTEDYLTTRCYEKLNDNAKAFLYFKKVKEQEERFSSLPKDELYRKVLKIN